MISTQKLSLYLSNLLKPKSYSDYGPNGLQIEGATEIQKIGFSVSATKESILKAVELKVDTMIVHHGLFWKFHGVRTITGPFAKRIKPLIQNNINLFAYHLPLDANKEVGNAFSIGQLLALKNIQDFGEHKGMPTGISGTFSNKITVSNLKIKLEEILDHKVLLSSHNEKLEVANIGIVTGGANSSWNYCIKDNLDCFLTGEMSEHDWHDAKESEIHMFAGGHHATERFGTIALLNNIQKKFKDNVECIFIDSANPA